MKTRLNIYSVLSMIYLLFIGISCGDSFLDQPPNGSYSSPQVQNRNGGTLNIVNYPNTEYLAKEISRQPHLAEPIAVFEGCDWDSPIPAQAISNIVQKREHPGWFRYPDVTDW